MTRSSYLLGLCAVAGITALGIYGLAHRSDSDSPVPTAQTGDIPSIPDLPVVAAEPLQDMATTATLEPVETPPVSNKISERGPLRIRKGQPIPELFPYEKEREEISELATKSGEANLNAVAAYLSHSDASVREEARLALVRMSVPEAVPILRKAANSAPVAQEAKELRESADFLAAATGLEPAKTPF